MGGSRHGILQASAILFARHSGLSREGAVSAAIADAEEDMNKRVEWGFFPKVVGFFPIRIFVHSCASVCIFVHFIVFLEH